MSSTRLPDTSIKAKLNDLLNGPRSQEAKSVTFADGSHWKLEVPTVNSLDYLRAIFAACAQLDVRIQRITETLGLTFHSKADIREYVALCDHHNCQLMMSVGPRAPYDIGRSAFTEHGKYAGYRIRGLTQLQNAVSEMMYAIDLNVRGFVIYDEGMLDVVNRLRQQNDIPAETRFKASAHMGHGNPASARLLQLLGANSINPIRDLPLADLCQIRATVEVPLDIHVDNPASSGGSIRYYDAPAMARDLSPVHLKIGNSVLDRHGSIGTKEQAAECVRRCGLLQEILRENAPDLKSSRSG